MICLYIAWSNKTFFTFIVLNSEAVSIIHFVRRSVQRSLFVLYYSNEALYRNFCEIWNVFVSFYIFKGLSLMSSFIIKNLLSYFGFFIQNVGSKRKSLKAKTFSFPDSPIVSSSLCVFVGLPICLFFMCLFVSVFLPMFNGQNLLMNCCCDLLQKFLVCLVFYPIFFNNFVSMDSLSLFLSHSSFSSSCKMSFTPAQWS